MKLLEQFKRFPVQVAVAALLVYLITLATGVTTSSLILTAKVAGWDYQPLAGQPLFWLLTLPLRLLPAAMIPLALNVLAAVCAAATLGFLTATLELTAWDRPLQTLAGWRARLPLLLGALVCGLEFSYWQAATQNNGESLHILIFASALWCLFKYRATKFLHWLKIACLIWGAGMAENWAMMLMLPFFAIAIFWLGRERLLNKSLLIRLALLGLAGFSLLLLPAIFNGLLPDSPWGVVESARETFRAFKSPLKSVYQVFWRGGKLAPMAAAIFYLLAVLPGLIRVQDTGTKNISPLDRYQVWLNRLLRGALLLLLLWLAFDPAVGLRQILREKFSVTLSLLSLDYLVALGVAILGGNLWLAFSQPQQLDSKRRHAPAIIFASLLALMTMGLVWRNIATITLPNRQPFAMFGADVLKNLPAQNGAVLADDALRLYSFAAAAGNRNRQWLAINTDLLTQPAYRRWLTNSQAGRFPQVTDEHLRTGVGTLQILESFTRSNAVFYLNPSFGLYFEPFYLRPAGLGQSFVKYLDHSISPPALTTEAIQTTEAFWDSATPRLAGLQQTCITDVRKFFGPAKLRLKPQVPMQSKLLAEWYAVALDDWGVQLQRAGRLEAAQKRFQQALGLNQHNVSAQINSVCNSNLLAARPMNLAWYPTLSTELGEPKKLARFLKLHGPVDEPAFCHLLAKQSARAGLARQALQLFLRADVLAPNTPAIQIELAGLYAQCGFENEARETIRSVREKLPATFMQTNAMLDVSLALLEAGTWLQSSNAAQSKNILQSVLDERPDDPQTALLILKAYLAAGDDKGALALTEKQIIKYPKDDSWQLQKALILDQSGKPALALTQLDTLLARTNYPPARLLRGKVRMTIGQWDQSEADLRQVMENADYNSVAHLGLAEIYLHRQDTNAALEQLRLGSEGVPTNSPYSQLIKQKISELKSK